MELQTGKTEQVSTRGNDNGVGDGSRVVRRDRVPKVGIISQSKILRKFSGIRQISSLSIFTNVPFVRASSKRRV